MSEILKLRDLIQVSSREVEQAVTAEAKVDGKVAAQAGSLQGYVASLGAEEVNKTLDLDIAELLLGAWTKVRSIKEAAGNAGQQVVKLGKHDFKYTCYPVLTFNVGELKLLELKLTLDLIATFESMAVSVADKRVKALAPGEAKATVKLSYKGEELKKVETSSLKLPGQMDFRPGMLVG